MMVQPGPNFFQEAGCEDTSRNAAGTRPIQQGAHMPRLEPCGCVGARRVLTLPPPRRTALHHGSNTRGLVGHVGGYVVQ